MIWLVILYVPLIGVSVFFFVRAIFKHIDAKEYFWNNLPDCEKDCINCLPRYPLFYYKGCWGWRGKIAEELEKRNKILMEYNREKAEQLIRAEKDLYWSWIAGAISTWLFAVCLIMR